ncbi:hypothetical protein RSAG8_13052, partial [Rhizoctonia solani AG-8 WAC10335]
MPHSFSRSSNAGKAERKPLVVYQLPDPGEPQVLKPVMEHPAEAANERVSTDGVKQVMSYRTLRNGSILTQE